MTRAALVAVLALCARTHGAALTGETAAPAAGKDAGAGTAGPEVERQTLGEKIPEPPPLPPRPRGLPDLPSGGGAELTAARAELGMLLFFEPRLSAGQARACAGCHAPAHGWADGEPRSTTVGGKPNLRHTPTLFNVGYHQALSWDGSMPTLEAHVLSHWKGQLGAEPDEVARALNGAPGYQARFQRAFGDLATRERVSEALAAYVRTLASGDAPWDRHEASVAGAVQPEAVEGSRVFNERAGCAVCHPPPLYTDLGFHARVSGDQADPGRARVTGDAADQGAFKTPGLRGLVHTAPYFHDGSAATLEAAVDAELAKSDVKLDANERRQLMAFLAALSGPAPAVEAPELPLVP